MEKMTRLDTVLTYVTLMFFFGALTPSRDAGGGDDAAAKMIVFLAVFTAPMVLILMFRNWEKFVKTLRRVRWPLLLCGLVVLSTLWSIEPRITLRRAIIFSVTTCFAVYLASLDTERRDHLLGRVALASILICFFIGLLLPEYGISGGNHFGDWRGGFDQKNILARQMDFSFFLALYSQAFRNRAVARTVAGLALVLLLLSGSGTGIAAFCIVLVFVGFLKIRSYFAARETEALFWVIVAPMFALVAAIGLGFRSELFELLGKNESLTGRTTIWSVVSEGISRRPILGWGYDAFFTQRELRSTFGAVGMPNHAHEGFLDIVLAVGFVGLAIFVIGYCIALWNAWRVYRNSSEPAAEWPLIFLVLLIVLNLTESNLLRNGTFTWLLYVSLALWGKRASESEPARGTDHGTEWSGQPMTA